MSLSGEKSFRTTDPKSDNRFTPCFRQKLAISSVGILRFVTGDYRAKAKVGASQSASQS